MIMEAITMTPDQTDPKAPFSLSWFKVPVHPGLMIWDELCHNRGGTMDNLGDPG